MDCKLSTIVVHLGLAVVLAGALMSYAWGVHGQVSLPQGQPVGQFALKEGTRVALPFELQLEQAAGYTAQVTILPEGERRSLSPNHVFKWQQYRFSLYDMNPEGCTLQVARDPWGTGLVYAGMGMLLLGLLGAFFRKDSRFRESLKACPASVKRASLAVAALLLLLFFFLLARKLLFQPLPPILRSPLLWVHVGSMMLAYTLFGLLALLCLTGLVNGSQSTLLMEGGVLALYPAVFLLAFGTAVGAVWANDAWGSYWSWDPKETWALITLIVYSVALHRRPLKAFNRPAFFHWYGLLAFLCVLITYLGVNTGLHAYS